MDFKSETTQTTTDDIDELFSWSEGWDFEYTQLTAGRLGFRERVVQLPGVAIKWHTATQAMLVRETFLSGLGFGFVRDSVGPTRWRGREIDVHDGLLYQSGSEQHYALGRSTSSMSIELDDRLVHALGWNLDCVAPLQRFDPVAIKDLELICAEVKWMTEQDAHRTFLHSSCSTGFAGPVVTSRCGLTTTSQGAATMVRMLGPSPRFGRECDPWFFVGESGGGLCAPTR